MSSSSVAYGVIGTTPLDACNNAVGSGICATLVAEGATDQQLLAVASGDADPITMMNELTGNNPVPFSVNSSVSDTLLGSLGSPLNAAANAASNVQNTISSTFQNFQTWLKSNLPIFLIVIVAILMAIAWAYGGFRIG